MRRVVIALVAVFTAIVAGLFAIFALAKYRLEHARITEQMAIVVDAPGSSVSSAENALAAPIEQALRESKGVDSIRTVVRPGQVVISAEVTVIGIDAEPPFQVVHAAVQKAQKDLPNDVMPPYVMRLDAESTKRTFIARSKTMSRLEFSQWLDDVFRRQLEVQRGVREIKLCGAVSPALEIRLDQNRLQAVGLAAGDVVDAIQGANLQIPGGRIRGSDIRLRVDTGGLEDLEQLELKGAQVRLRDVAQLQTVAKEGLCSSAQDVLVTVSAFPDAELKLPSHPDVTITPFTAKRVATFLSPSGTSVQDAMRALSQRHRDAMITAERDELTVWFPEEPQRIDDVPGLALRSMDDRHAIIEVKGPDFEQLISLGGKVRELLAKEQTRWLGTVWPGLGPEKVIKHDRSRGVVSPRDLSELLQLALGGVYVGRLDDRTDVRVVTDARLEELRLPDGQPVTQFLEISETLGPAAMLRLNSERAVELEVGLETREVQRVLSSLQLPQGYSLSVSER